MKIGNLDLCGNVFLAPMAGLTDPPFRRVVQQYGVAALWTEMISAHAVVAGSETFRTMNCDGHTVPTVFQIHGTDPVIMAAAAERIQDMGAVAVDINMGCPAKPVVRRGAGAALMNDLGLAGRIVEAVRRVLSIPLTVKTRLGWDDYHLNAVSLSRVVEDAGADAVILHSRSRSKKHAGPVSLQGIAQVKAGVNIPVIGNGGIDCVEDAKNMLDATDCDGVMIGRGALQRPWLPGKIMRRLVCGDATDRPVGLLDVVRSHLEFQREWWDAETAVWRMRKYLAWYSKGLDGGSTFRRLIFQADHPARVMECVEEFMGKVVES
jgi:tRNA-dihydrouridine synthase B